MNIAYNMDCLEAMRQMPDKYFDLAVVDPPYGIGIDGQTERYDVKNPKHSRKGHTKKTGTSLFRQKSILMNFLGSAKTKLYGAAIILLSIFEKVTKAGLYGTRDKGI